MSRRLLATIAALAAFTAPALAADLGYEPPLPAPETAMAGFGGDIAIYGGYMWSHIVEPEDPPDISQDAVFSGALFGGLARGNWWLGPTTNLQVDLFADRWASNEFSNKTGWVWDAATHLDWGHPGGGLFGAMLSIGQNSDFGDPQQAGSFATGALEAQLSEGAFGLYAQAGYSSSFAGGGGDFSEGALWAGYTHLAARYAMGQNASLGADVGYAILPMGEHTRHILRWGATLEAMLPNTSLGVFLNYQGHYDDASGTDEHVTNNAVMAGIKFRFNGDASSSMRVDYNPFTGVNAPRDAY